MHTLSTHDYAATADAIRHSIDAAQLTQLLHETPEASQIPPAIMGREPWVKDIPADMDSRRVELKRRLEAEGYALRDAVHAYETLRTQGLDALSDRDVMNGSRDDPWNTLRYAMSLAYRQIAGSRGRILLYLAEDCRAQDEIERSRGLSLF